MYHVIFGIIDIPLIDNCLSLTVTISNKNSFFIISVNIFHELSINPESVISACLIKRSFARFCFMMVVYHNS